MRNSLGPQGHVPSDCVSQYPLRQKAGPTFPETDTQPTPVWLEPADASPALGSPPSLAASAAALVPGAQDPEQTSEY
jgi:hypothetical protein